MFMPHLLRSFIYRLPTSLKEHLIWLASHDLCTAAFFCRRFFWSEINVWPEQLPPDRTVRWCELTVAAMTMVFW
jgi:hypothetical protein